MKFSLYTLTLLVVLLLSSTSCDSQKTNATSTTTDEPPAMTKGNTEPVAGVTITELDSGYEGFEKAYFAGGCFWCTEASFDRIVGVKDVWSGYAGGKEVNPTYGEVAGGQTGHAEAIVVYYDPAVRTYEDLLEVFFVAHDPTQLNRQGPDRGTQYRSTIFPVSEEQYEKAKAKIIALDKSGKFSSKIQTTIEDPIEFYIAEAYHQDYYEDTSNPNQGYVQNVSRPKVEKVMEVFKDWLKPEFVK
ncbi:peptide-methionine (S)-S-oxide reductase MsrA [Neolewinella persica]|uniref:peptide-methionine (S)-S-oxide reductase MsrA n=1 Tax=Neolewinella persica TaxID=70998 RepID=UPI00037A2696|nr:peptide-methionine (S)-S-oxide reductase MsrA [Neolewinella persica]